MYRLLQQTPGGWKHQDYGKLQKISYLQLVNLVVFYVAKVQELGSLKDSLDVP